MLTLTYPTLQIPSPHIKIEYFNGKQLRPALFIRRSFGNTPTQTFAIIKDEKGEIKETDYLNIRFLLDKGK